MKIGGFVPNSVIDYPGKISAVVFTQGCNFKCPFCHNGELVRESLPALKEEDVLQQIKDRSKLIEGVVISGGEPLIQHGLFSFLEGIKSLGLKVKLDTNGYKADVLERLIDAKLIDYIAMDMKAPYKKYSACVGGVRVNVTHIYWAIGLLMGSSDEMDYEFRTTVLPDFDHQDIKDIGSMIRGSKRFALQTFRNEHTLDSGWKFKAPVPQTTMEEYKKIMEGYVKEVELRI